MSRAATFATKLHRKYRSHHPRALTISIRPEVGNARNCSGPLVPRRNSNTSSFIRNVDGLTEIVKFNGVIRYSRLPDNPAALLCRLYSLEIRIRRKSLSLPLIREADRRERDSDRVGANTTALPRFPVSARPRISEEEEDAARATYRGGRFNSSRLNARVGMRESRNRSTRAGRNYFTRDVTLSRPSVQRILCTRGGTARRRRK